MSNVKSMNNNNKKNIASPIYALEKKAKFKNKRKNIRFKILLSSTLKLINIFDSGKKGATFLIC